MSQKVFNTSKFWLILSKNFLDLGIEFVYEKMTTYKVVSPRKSLFSMRTFSTLKQFLQQTLHTLFYKHQINLLNAGIKAHLFYGEKKQCNTGKSIISS